MDSTRVGEYPVIPVYKVAEFDWPLKYKRLERILFLRSIPGLLEKAWLDGADWPTLHKLSGWPYWRIREYLEAKYGTAIRSEYDSQGA